MKVSKTLYNALFNVLVAIIMSTMMSLVLTLVNVGMVEGFAGIWLKSLLISIIVAIPVTFVAIPSVGRLLSFIEIE